MIYGILKTTYALHSVISDADVVSIFTAPISILNNQPAFSEDSMNLRRRAGRQGVQRWEITSNIASSNSSADMLVHTSIYGTDLPFYVRMPQVAGLRLSNNTLLSDLKVNTTASAASKNATNIVTAVALTPGEFINIGINTKVYLVADVVGNVATIVPPLLSSIDNGSSVFRNGDVTLYCRYDTDTKLGIIYVDGVLSDPGSIKLVEKL
jgi:hypothetical protein